MFPPSTPLPTPLGSMLKVIFGCISLLLRIHNFNTIIIDWKTVPLAPDTEVCHHKYRYYKYILDET
uniref:Uncharacterized protein n=1 Tax=Anguilla anguilla TaxID=7936 RepID=A0A0E9UYW0_ANGAN